MALMRGLLYSVVGGAIGACVWAAIIYLFSFQVVIASIFISVFVVIGFLKGAPDHRSALAGFAVSLIALVALLAGRYTGGYLKGLDHVVQIMPKGPVTDEELQLQLAIQIADEYAQAGMPVEWPAGESVELADSEADFPPKIWADMTARWRSLTPNEIELRRASLTQDIQAATQTIPHQIALDTLAGNFNDKNVIMILVLFITAYVPV